MIKRDKKTSSLSISRLEGKSLKFEILLDKTCPQERRLCMSQRVKINLPKGRAWLEIAKIFSKLLHFSKVR